MSRKIYNPFAVSPFKSPFSNPFGSSTGPKLPRTGLLALYRNGEPDTIGLSVADYSDVPATIQSVFFGPGPTLLSLATIWTNVLASSELNEDSGLVGNDSWIALYAAGTDLSIIQRAQRLAEGSTPAPPPPSSGFPYQFPFILA